jgi:PAS domain S-box-containing protein
VRSIGAKLAVGIGVLLLAFSGAALFRTWCVARAHAMELTREQTAMALEFDLAIREYVGEKIRPEMQKRVGKEEFIPEAMSTSFVARSVFEKVRKRFPDAVLKFSSNNPRNPANRASRDERKIIEYFKENPDAKRWVGEVRLGERVYYGQFNARRMEESCLRCHGDPADAPASLVARYGDTAGFHRAVGDVAALDAVAIPLDGIHEALAADIAEQSSVMLIAVGLLFAAIIVTARFLIGRRLLRLSDHVKRMAAKPDANEIAPVKFSGRDEISHLASGYNALVRKLRSFHASFQEKVEQRTRDLSDANRRLQQRTEELDTNRRIALSMMKDAEEAKESAEEAKRQVEEREERLRAILTSIHETMIAVIGRDGRAMHAWGDPELGERYGMEIPALAGHSLEEVLPHQAKEISGWIEQVFQTGLPLREEILVAFPGGGFWQDVSLCAMRGPSREPSAVVVSMKDTTQRRRLQNELERARKLEAVGQLAAGIAHEINTPLQYTGDNTQFIRESLQELSGVIDSCRSLLEAGKSGSLTPERIAEAQALFADADIDYLLAETPQAIEQSLEGIHRVTEIVRAIRDFSRSPVGEKVSVDLNRSIESTITMCRNEWKHVAEMETDLDADLPAVPCLPGELNRVILNLITNAAHAIRDAVGEDPPARGTVRVTTRRDGGWVEIRVSDTGNGIPDEIRSRIFDPFFTTKEVGSAAGHGLTVTHSLVVEKHGGTLDFETEVGVGTTFIVRLPIDGAAARETAATGEGCR